MKYTNKNTIGNIMKSKVNSNTSSKLLDDYRIYYNPESASIVVRKQKERIMQYDKNILNPVQQHYYDRAIKGFGIFTKEELYQMNSSKKERIKRNYQKTQKIINKYKWEKVKEMSDNIFKLFFNSKLSDSFLNQTIEDENEVNIMSLKELNISKMDIVNLLFNNKILPSNFFSLK